MQITLGALAQLVGGNAHGNSDLCLTGAAPLDDVQAQEVTLIDHKSRVPKLLASSAAAVVVTPALVEEVGAFPAIVVADLHVAFIQILLHFRPATQPRRTGISPQAVVPLSAQIGRDVEIHPFATIGENVTLADGATIHAGVRILDGCQIGPGATIYPNAVLYENTRVGARSIIHAGVVLGCHGFGYKLVNGRHQSTGQLGYVQIGDDVEIGAGTTIDRGTYGATVVGEGTKIDDQVMIGHNCHLGRHNLLCSQVGIAGSSSTGDYVVMAGQVGLRDHIHIGDRSVLGARSGVAQDVPPDSKMLGAPAIPERDQRMQFVMLAKLPEMRKQLQELERRMQALMGEKSTQADRSAA